MFATHKEVDIAVKTLFGFEELLAEELRELGVEHLQTGNRIVHFKGDLAMIYRCCLNLRLALRVYIHIHSFRADDANDLYAKAMHHPWESILTKYKTFAIDFTVNSPLFRHGKYASLKLKDAIVDRIRDHTGGRPNVDTEEPDYRFYLHISNNEVDIYLDAAGESLHKRGYRKDTGPAPINEVLAAGIIKLSGWDRQSPFMDAMCGSGTIPIEAALMAKNIPPLWKRQAFGFREWSNFNPGLWRDIRSEARKKMSEYEGLIYASDISDKAVRVAIDNIIHANVDDVVSIKRMAFDQLRPKHDHGTLIINPPYGERMQKDDIMAFYKSVGDTLKNHFPGWDAWVFSSNIKALKNIGLRPSRKIKLFAGKLESRLMHFPLYHGSKE